MSNDICVVGTDPITCTSCKLCSKKCPTEVDLEKVVVFKRYLEEPRGSHRDLFLLINNLLINSEESEWIRDVKTGKDDVYFFPGCSALYDILLQRDTNYSGSAQAIVKTLNYLGISPKIIYGCCGHDLYYAGRLDEFEEMRKNLKEKLPKKIEAKGKNELIENEKMAKETIDKGKIIVGCAECFHSLKNFYNVEVVHFSDFVLENIDKFNFKKTELKTTYHDPCRLGRHNSIYDSPRKVLEKISDFREMEFIKENSHCCGVSAWMNCNKESKKQREDRLKEAELTDAEYLIVNCPKCRVHLDCVYYEENYKGEPKKLNIIDFAELVGYSLDIYNPLGKEKSYEVKKTKGKQIEPIEIVKDPIKYVNDELVEHAFRCSTCYSCVEICLTKYHTPEMMEEVRKFFVDKNLSPQAHRRIYNSLVKFGNVFDDTRVIAEENENAEIIYFPGCVAKYRNSTLIESTKRILRELGIKYTIPKELVCCGSVMFRTGHDPSFLVKKNTEIMKGRKVITSCSGCFATLKKNYEGIDVMHTSDFIKDKIGKLKMKGVKAKVSFHDPCHIGRKFGFYEPPREVIKLIPQTELIEFKENRENAQCCGAGGGIKSAKPDLANKLAKKRMQDAKELGVDLVLSICPFCELNLGQNSDMKVIDLVDYLVMAIDGKGIK